MDLLSDDPDIDELRNDYCDEILYEISAGYIEYGNHAYFKDDELILLFINEVSKISEKKPFLLMMNSFFQGDEKQVYKYFDSYVGEIRKQLVDRRLNEREFVYLLSEPLKEAFPGFWEYAQTSTVGLWESDGTDEMCQLMADVYGRSSDDDAIDKLTAFIQKYPDITVSREYLAIVYGNAKMWNNALAMLESVTEPNLFGERMDEYYSIQAWCYGKIKDYKQEESCYRRALEVKPSGLFLLNNYGYCLYKQKRFNEAKLVFEQCISEKRDQPLAANNYIKTLIALGRNKDAKDFLKNTTYKINNNLKDKVKHLSATNKRISSNTTVVIMEDTEEVAVAQEPVLSVKGQQFSNEKILEDELTSRIENGIPVFGKHLKMYRRKGEYGRQYIIPIGRLDLLCEDNNGELYIIELKKDSGYDDAFEQTVRYLDWFQNSDKFKNIKVNGIICLNNPSAELVERVHGDERMKVFEYQISYKEL